MEWSNPKVNPIGSTTVLPSISYKNQQNLTNNPDPVRMTLHDHNYQGRESEDGSANVSLSKNSLASRNSKVNSGKTTKFSSDSEFRTFSDQRLEKRTFASIQGSGVSQGKSASAPLSSFSVAHSSSSVANYSSPFEVHSLTSHSSNNAMGRNPRSPGKIKSSGKSRSSLARGRTEDSGNSPSWSPNHGKSLFSKSTSASRSRTRQDFKEVQPLSTSTVAEFSSRANELGNIAVETSSKISRKQRLSSKNEKFVDENNIVQEINRPNNNSEKISTASTSTADELSLPDSPRTDGDSLPDEFSKLGDKQAHKESGQRASIDKRKQEGNGTGSRTRSTRNKNGKSKRGNRGKHKNE